jgi:thioredoxin-dependent peroxiredoxin
MNPIGINQLQQAKVGEIAPDFILSSSAGGQWQLSQHRGKVIALVFYPQDETLVCTRQMCSLRDRWSEYLSTGAEIIGISDGTTEDHIRFAKHHHLPIQLLADFKSKVTKAYGYKWLPTQLTRAIVVINPEGFVLFRKIMPSMIRPNDDEVISMIMYARTQFLRKR